MGINDLLEEKVWFLVTEIKLVDRHLVCIIVDITTNIILNFCIKTQNSEQKEKLQFTSKEILDFYKETIKKFQKPTEIRYDTKLSIFSENIRNLTFFSKAIRVWALKNSIELSSDSSLMSKSINYLIQIYLIRQIIFKNKNTSIYKAFKKTWPDNFQGCIEPKLKQFRFRKMFFESIYFNENINLETFLKLIINQYNIDCKLKSLDEQFSNEQLELYFRDI